MQLAQKKRSDEYFKKNGRRIHSETWMYTVWLAAIEMK